MKSTFFYLFCFIFLSWMTSCHRPLETHVPFIEPPDAPGHSPPASGERAPISPSLTPIMPPSSSFVPQPSKTRLPAPLYALSGESEHQQIWRLETDGRTAWPLTDEATGITDFDVSPTTGQLVYTTGDNRLMLADPFAQEAELLDDKQGENDQSVSMKRPRWSPDGKKIAYTLLDLHLIDVVSKQRQTLLKSQLIAEESDSGQMSHFYYPESWSPDGKQLLVEVQTGETSYFLPFNMADRMLNEFDAPAELACCDPIWGHNSQSLYFAYDGPTIMLLGLRQANLRTGQIRSLLSENGNGWPIISRPTLALDGTLYAWRHPSQDKHAPNALPSEPPILQRLSPQHVSEQNSWQIVNPERHQPLETLWSPDFTLAIIRVANPATDKTGDELRWLPATDYPSRRLPLQGHTLHWGRELPLLALSNKK